MQVVPFNPETFAVLTESTAKLGKYALEGVALSDITNDADWRVIGQVNKSHKKINIEFETLEDAKAFIFTTRCTMHDSMVPSAAASKSFLRTMACEKNELTRRNEGVAFLRQQSFFQQASGVLPSGSCKATLYNDNSIYPSGVKIILSEGEATVFRAVLAEADLHFANWEESELKTIANDLLIERMVAHYLPQEDDSAKYASPLTFKEIAWN